MTAPTGEQFVVAVPPGMGLRFGEGVSDGEFGAGGSNPQNPSKHVAMNGAMSLWVSNCSTNLRLGRSLIAVGFLKIQIDPSASF